MDKINAFKSYMKCSCKSSMCIYINRNIAGFKNMTLCKNKVAAKLIFIGINLILYAVLLEQYPQLYKLHHEKTNILLMQKQRRRSAVQ